MGDYFEENTLGDNGIRPPTDIGGGFRPTTHGVVDSPPENKGEDSHPHKTDGGIPPPKTYTRLHFRPHNTYRGGSRHNTCTVWIPPTSCILGRAHTLTQSLTHNRYITELQRWWWGSATPREVRVLPLYLLIADHTRNCIAYCSSTEVEKGAHIGANLEMFVSKVPMPV